MAKTFVQQIEQLRINVLEGNFEIDTMFATLDEHVGRARRMRALTYEVEALNTIAMMFVTTNRIQEAIHYFDEALAKSYQTNDIDLILRVNDNLATMLLNVWDTEGVERVVSKCLSLSEIRQFRGLIVGRLYFAMAEAKILQYDYDAAQDYINRIQEILKHVDLRKHSYFQYFQLDIVTQRQQILIHIANGQCEQAAERIKIFDAHLKDQEDPKYVQLISIHTRIIYALVCAQDEAEAHRLEEQVRPDLYPGLAYFYPSMSLDVATFLVKHNQLAWAKRIATHAINIIPEDQTDVFTILINAAHAIIDQPIDTN